MASWASREREADAATPPPLVARNDGNVSRSQDARLTERDELGSQPGSRGPAFKAGSRSASREPTPVTVWAPAFHWLTHITPDNTLGGPFSDDNLWCRLCQQPVPPRDRKAHAKRHQRELDLYRKRIRRQVEQARKARLRLVNRLKKELQ